MKRILLAGGGTGGHIYPGLAVAEAVRRHDEKAQIFFAGTTRPIDARVLSTVEGLTVITQPIGPFSAGPVGVLRFGSRWLRSYGQMAETLRTHHIEAVLGLGGFGSTAALVAAGRRGVRRAIFNPDAVPGKANRLFGRRADEVFVQWQTTAEFFERQVKVVGCPLRTRIKRLATSDRYGLREEAIRTFELDNHARTLFVWGGSTGARSVNQAVLKVLSQEVPPDDLQILHMTGRHDFEDVRQRYAQEVRLKHRVVDYIDRLDLALAVADLAVGRAGAVGLAELAAAAVPAVLMPYPHHRDQHQRANAMVLAEAGGAVLVDDDGEAGDQTVKALSEALKTLLSDEAKLQKMARQLRQLAKLDADEEMAQWLIAN